MTSLRSRFKLVGLIVAATITASAGFGIQAQTSSTAAPADGVATSMDPPYLAPADVSAATRALTPGAAVTASFTATDWPTFGMNTQRTGYNPVETVLTTSNVASLRTHWATDLGGPILTQPTLAAGVSINGVPTDVVYAATLLGDMYALNASTGAVIWHMNVPPVQSGCSDFAASGGKVGFIGTPTIDRTRNQLYIVSGDGFLHAYNLATGADLPALHVKIPDAANAPPRTFVYGSPTISTTSSGTSLYIATASACDTPPYHGQVARVSIPDGTILERWYPTGATGPNGGGIWGPGGVSVVRGGSAVYVLTGNAIANPQTFGYSDQAVELTSDLKVVASNAPSLPHIADADFGATPTLLTPRGCQPMLAAFQKTGNLYIYGQSKIQTGPLQTLPISQPRSSGTNIGLPAFDPVLNQLYMAAPSHSPTGFDNHGLLGLGFSNCSVNLIWQQPVGKDSVSDNPAISPVAAKGVVYYADGIASQVFAMDAKSGQILWSTSSLPLAERPTGGILTSPTVVNGQLFVAGMDHKIHAFGL